MSLISRLFGKANQKTDSAPRNGGSLDDPEVRQAAEDALTLDSSNMDAKQRLAAADEAHLRQQRFMLAADLQDGGPPLGF